MKSGKCWGCGAELTALDYGRADRCRKCGKDTKVCRNCTFYDRTQNNECRETQAERVVDKERSNFCEYFSPSSTGGTGPSREDLKAAAESLFKKK